MVCAYCSWWIARIKSGLFAYFARLEKHSCFSTNWRQIGSVPTVKRIKGYRFFFFSEEGTEMPHIHVEKGDEEAKFWLEPVALAKKWGFAPHEINEISRLIADDQAFFVRKYRKHHEKRKS